MFLGIISKIHDTLYVVKASYKHPSIIKAQSGKEYKLTVSAKSLEQELAEVESQVTVIKEKLAAKPDYTRGVGDPRITSWELDRVLLEQLESRVESLKQAIQRMDEGTYGICESCGKQIHPDRLAVLPDTKLCIDCARKK
jgi:DnaK suppressor protein